MPNPSIILFGSPSKGKRMKCLRYFRKDVFPHTLDYCQYALSNGCLSPFQCLVEGVELTHEQLESLCEAVIGYGQNNDHDLFRDLGLDIEHGVQDKYQGHDLHQGQQMLECVQYLVGHYDVKMDLDKVAEQGHLLIIKWLLNNESSFTCTAKVCDKALDYNHDECVAYLHQHGYSPSPEAIERLVNRYCETMEGGQCLKYVVEHCLLLTSWSNRGPDWFSI